jgi:hypothetical protein
VFPVRYRHTYRVELSFKYNLNNRTMDSVHNCDSYINISLSQTYRSYLQVSSLHITTATIIIIIITKKHMVTEEKQISEGQCTEVGHRVMNWKRFYAVTSVAFEQIYLAP